MVWAFKVFWPFVLSLIRRLTDYGTKVNLAGAEKKAWEEAEGKVLGKIE